MLDQVAAICGLWEQQLLYGERVTLPPLLHASPYVWKGRTVVVTKSDSSMFAREFTLPALKSGTTTAYDARGRDPGPQTSNLSSELFYIYAIL